MRNFYVHKLPSLICFTAILLFIIPFHACNEKRVNISEQTIVETPQQINRKAEDVIQGTLKDLMDGKKINDSISLWNIPLLNALYSQGSYRPVWSTEGNFQPHADSLLLLLDSALLYGLFPQDYHYSWIRQLVSLLNADTTGQAKLDVSKWATADLLMSSALAHMIRDLKLGRILPDSVIQRDSLLTEKFQAEQFRAFFRMGVEEFVSRLEPPHRGYHDLRLALRNFLQEADLKKYTYIHARDSALLPALIYKRIAEEDSLLSGEYTPADTLTLAEAVKRFQKKNKLTVDGKAGPVTIRMLNNTGLEKMIRIAITMDRFRMMPPLPEKHIWVNIPGFYLQLRDADTVVLESRVVVGKPETRTPVITSAISDMITYPKWHIPESIIKKEILPGLKRDPSYTIRRGYSLVDNQGNEIDPMKVNWANYRTMIPYRVIQGSGDDNALGVLKFNFPNKFAVYLHDTNQRHLFSRSDRSLSHGCVRVQAWHDLARYILRNDSLNARNAVPVDSLDSWLAAKEKHVIPVRKRIPLYIRYFSCEAREGRIVFFDDIYGEDRKLREEFFHDK